MPATTHSTVFQAKVGSLVEWVLSGEIRIPAFQRSYRWRRDDVLLLFDSILRGYPIGTLLMWRRPAGPATLDVGPLVIHAAESPYAMWVVDGQQRITSLVGALAAPPDTVDPRFRVFYDLAEDRFVSAGRRNQIPDHWMPVSLALDTVRLIRWQHERTWLGEDAVARCLAVAVAIRDYAVPVHIVEGGDEGAVQDIFDRINTSGRSLTRPEIFNALRNVADQMQPSDLQSLAASVRGFGFGPIPERVLIQSVLIVNRGRLARDQSFGFGGEGERRAAFKKTEYALGGAVEFLREVAGIPHVRLLPYMLFLVILARFNSVFGSPEGRAAELLRRWVWRGSVLGVAPLGAARALRQNTRVIDGDPVASADRLLQLLDKKVWRADLSAIKLNTAQAKVNILALLSRHPHVLARDDGGMVFDTGPVDAWALMDTDGSPLARLASHDLPLAESIANCFVHPPAETARSLRWLLDEASYSDFQSAFHSHVIDQVGIRLWRAGSAEEFLARRAEHVRELIESHVQENALFGFPDGPGLPRLGGEE
ncbi:hypothetical protein Ssi03_58990 [Sphaerisporangium siamense]|uniref:GmrSD restriction endonucleases N-terminal domain-containing protein n=1 Tax=Sphaerisporangium siamense TaxID=795645 RepID=A0A7W7G6N3_9ACTN|nr:DUF262 domain-containing protein [Sphaerisporangium siamense]MBB4699728.1 hypothetical protein [Sphaerisporangium siamense]GII87909.1 hypothetical protein Ssi03_58990 [Sphaerisporangium siamense]